MIDARGYVCPTPVIMVQKEIKTNAPSSLEVIVDNQCAVENVTRFGKNCGYTVNMEPQGRDFLLKLKK